MWSNKDFVGKGAGQQVSYQVCARRQRIARGGAARDHPLARERVVAPPRRPRVRLIRCHLPQQVVSDAQSLAGELVLGAAGKLADASGLVGKVLNLEALQAGSTVVVYLGSQVRHDGAVCVSCSTDSAGAL